MATTEAQKQYYLNNRARIRERQRVWNLANKEKRKDIKARSHRLRTYGLTDEQFQALMLAQCGRCAICGDPMERPYVDHNHETGEIRGLLCNGCNKGVGLLQDNPEVLISAANYLKEVV